MTHQRKMGGKKRFEKNKRGSKRLGEGLGAGAKLIVHGSRGQRMDINIGRGQTFFFFFGEVGGRGGLDGDGRRGRRGVGAPRSEFWVGVGGGGVRFPRPRSVLAGRGGDGPTKES